jgi:hypothetical protein
MAPAPITAMRLSMISSFFDLAGVMISWSPGAQKAQTWHTSSNGDARDHRLF